MENNKYYTPSIEEFHEGFEFEFCHYDYPENGWKKYNTPEFNWEREDCPFGRKDLSEFRVKYLDREDIESLGWIWIEDGKFPNAPTLFKWNSPLPNDKDVYWHLNLHPEQTIVIDNNQWYDANYCIFNGKIKNKSELQRLMKQLGI